MLAQYRVSQVDPQRWQVDQWGSKGWNYFGIYSSQSAANAAVAALVPQVLAAPTYFDLQEQPTLADPIQEINGA